MDVPFIVYAFWDTITVLYVLMSIRVYRSHHAMEMGHFSGLNELQRLRLYSITVIYILLSLSIHFSTWDSSTPRMVLVTIILLMLMFDLLSSIFRKQAYTPPHPSPKPIHPPSMRTYAPWMQAWMGDMDELSAEYLRRTRERD